MSTRRHQEDVLLGICGGVGPAAGVLLHQTILEHTENQGLDEGHLNVCHFSRSADMTDRTEFLLHKKNKNNHKQLENPALGMARTFEMIRKTSKSSRSFLIAGVPCNTFHAPLIWQNFLKQIKAKKRQKEFKIIHMLEETVQFILHHAPTSRKIGLMSTTGTREARVYHDLLEPLGYEVIEVSMLDQIELHETIYHEKWGIKSTAPMVNQKCILNFDRYARSLVNQGAEVIIMGCTEIPFAFVGQTTSHGALLVDPLVALSRAMIREVDPTRLKPLDMDLWTRKRTYSGSSFTSTSGSSMTFESEEDDEEMDLAPLSRLHRMTICTSPSSSSSSSSSSFSPTMTTSLPLEYRNDSE